MGHRTPQIRWRRLMDTGRLSHGQPIFEVRVVENSVLVGHLHYEASAGVIQWIFDPDDDSELPSEWRTYKSFEDACDALAVSQDDPARSRTQG
jgi:hypothetical protein